MPSNATYTCPDCPFGAESYAEWKDHRDAGCQDGETA
jgi:hypothetical protein